ncbi:hypothetical protein DIE14_01770 [Burkholderia sp. Bp9017]|nr:hypothetical protein DIE14_01770 [Burkholderia sp. Bp9017]RQZ37935.1 hypothetical protein DIE13_01760 [Burkholderia sp. Bp9016]
MMRLGMKTIDEFAERLGTPKRTLENWLASPDSSSYRTMPEIAWKFVREILQNARGRGVIGF